jgi:hypothetical protein
MKDDMKLLVASVLALLLAFGIILRITTQKGHFDRTVSEALQTSEGYDQKFIDMVNRLEDELAKRASFGYSGGKDPMTGTMRQVVHPVAATPAPRRVRAPAHPAPAPAAAPQKAPEPAGDQVKLTAIIADATGRKMTAIVMDGERSFAVDPGDIVAGRKITRITNEGIYMEDNTLYYFYDIYGKRMTKKK